MMNPTITQAVEFTDTYKKYKDAPIAIREAMCFKTQYPALLAEIQDTDMFAGRRTRGRFVYVGTFWWWPTPDYTPENEVGTKQGGYCFDFSALHRLPQNDEEKKALEELSAFWKNECTVANVYANTDRRDAVGFLFANDLDKLVKKGLPGLISDVTAMPESDFRTGLLIVLETVVDVCRFYQKQAEKKGREDIAKNLSAIIEHAPKTMAQAIQLILLFELLSHETNYEINWIDVALGDFFAKEIDAGSMTEEQAVQMIHSFYKMIFENGGLVVCRLIMGGINRRNAENADRFIMAALKAEQRHKQVIPQVSLRIYNGMNPKVLELAYDTINETYTYPTLYNDDAIIDGIALAFGVSKEEARYYYPLACGEMILAHKSPALFCTNWNIAKSVDDGIRAYNADTGSNGSFEELYQSVLVEIKREAMVLAPYHNLIIDKCKAQCAFLMCSLLTEDCIQNGKSLLEGGARYIGGCIMAHGFTNSGDALLAIKKVVYEDKTFSLSEVIKALDADFAGYETLHKALLAVPKYGNDDDEADAMVARLCNDITVITQKAGKECGLDFLNVSSVNPGGYGFGKTTGATADGRHKGVPFAIGNSPTAGNDKNGLTALMNSLIKTDPQSSGGGAITNFKISREFFTSEREKFEALFSAFWEGGGLQANMMIVNKNDLQAAMKEPEKFPHLLVRLGGWTARFIDLERSIQEEMIKRTLY